MVLELKISTLLETITEGIRQIKGEDITILDLTQIENIIFDYFIVCTGNSSTQISAIAASVREQVFKNIREKPFRIEGLANAQWVLMDYDVVIVHIFQKSTREYYGIENLWGDAIKLERSENDQMKKTRQWIKN